jgi:peptidoglycan/LPS O-acetylase OafA/YrhL
LLNIGWMLTHLIYFYFVFFIFHWLGRENLLPGALILWALVVTGGQAYFHFDGSGRPWLDLALHPYTLEFITGCGLGIIFRRSSNQGGWFFLTGGLILYLSSLFLLNWFPSPGIVSGWSRVFHFGPPAALILYGLIGLESRGRRFSPSVLVKLGDVSYSIYLSHILILALAGRLWALYPSSGRLNHWASLMIMMGAVVAFGMISYRYLEVPLMSIFRDWGRRLMPRGRLESKIL